MTNQKMLFEIREENLETGLRGVPVGYCSTSKVDGLEGLFYRGYPVTKLAEKKPEEIMYLLFYGEMPSDGELAKFTARLKRYRLDPQMSEHLRSLPKAGHPMKWFLSALNFLGMTQGKEDWEEDCFQVMALIPEVVAMIYRIRSGWGDPVATDPNLDYMDNFVSMLSLPQPKADLNHLMRIFDILHFDHGGGNLSTFTGKVVASGHADMYESLVAAMAGLSGPLHGKANQKCLSFIKKIHHELDESSNEEKLETYLRELIDQGEKVYGFGHAVLRVEDPRATVLYEFGKKMVGDDPLFKIALNLRKVGVTVLSSFGKIQNPYPNVDIVSGSLLSAMGLKDEDYYTVLFGMSRCIGIACQIHYERVLARSGKGTPIIRPKYIYTGPTR